MRVLDDACMTWIAAPDQRSVGCRFVADRAVSYRLLLGRAAQLEEESARGPRTPV